MAIMGGVRGPLPLFDFSIELCNQPYNHLKNVHVSWVRSDGVLSPKMFRSPLYEFSGSASANDLDMIEDASTFLLRVLCLS